MNPTDISFPHLGIYLENVPKSFSVFGFEIALYGVIMASSILLGIVVAAHIAKKTGQDPDTYWDLALYAVIFSIICARIYYVVFMWDYYKENPLQILNLRGGGIAIYGGIIGAIISVYAYCKWKKQKPRLILDTVAFGLLAGQITGRWGNFFNREVFGGYTDSLLAMRLPIDAVRARDITEELAAHIEPGTNYIQVHPTFLYEGLWNLGVLLLLLLFLKKGWKRFDGEIWLLYLAGYGIGRAIIEYIRTDQLYITGTTIPVSLVLGIVMAVVSIGIIAFVRLRPVKAGDAVTPEETTVEAEPVEAATAEVEAAEEAPAETLPEEREEVEQG